MKCPNPDCDAFMIWQADFDGDDEDNPVIHTAYTCPECETEACITTKC